MRLSSDLFKWSLSFFLAAALSLFRLKTFESWDQVQTIWDGQITPLLMAGHPHFFRYLVAYPGFLLENILPGNGFSWYICIFFAFNVVLFGRISNLGIRRSPGSLVIAIFISFHFVMNGRGVICWTAWLLACSICLESASTAVLSRRLPLVMLSTLLASVSTGVFIVSTSMIFAFLSKEAFLYLRRLSNPKVLLPCLFIFSPFLYLASSYLIRSIKKNLDFYGGGLSGGIVMLDHGLGRFTSLTEILFLLGVMLVFLSTVYVYLGGSVRLLPLTKLTFFALAGGFYGFTVLTLAIPPLLLRIRGRVVRPRVLLPSIGQTIK